MKFIAGLFLVLFVTANFMAFINLITGKEPYSIGVIVVYVFAFITLLTFAVLDEIKGWHK